MEQIDCPITMNDKCHAVSVEPKRTRLFCGVTWLLGLAVTLALLLANPHSAVADCIVVDGTMICTGDLSAGISFTSPPWPPVLSVLALTTDITPAMGVDGVELLGMGGQTLSVDFTGFNINLGQDWSILTSGDDARGMDALTSANNGANGRDGTLFRPTGGNGGGGGTGGAATVDSVGGISTAGSGADSISARSLAGRGGNGGSAFALSFARGGHGGAGGAGGHVIVTGAGPLDTTGAEDSHGIVAQTEAGGGGNGGDGAAGANGGLGGAGGSGGAAEVEGSWSITTMGNESHGILSRSQAGNGGRGGESRSGGVGGLGGAVQVHFGGTIATAGVESRGVLAVSQAGAGGMGGDALQAGNGGVGGAGGAGGDVTLLGNGIVTTNGVGSHGMQARSEAGAGGNGGPGGDVSGTGGRGGVGGVGGEVSVGRTQEDPVSVFGSWNITTSDADSHAILAESLGGTGGNGDDQNVAAEGGAGGEVGVYTSGDLFTGAEDSYAISALSQGGAGGKGGDGAGISGSGREGGGGGDGAAIEVSTSGVIGTGGKKGSYGIFARSHGGAGGAGGVGVPLTVGNGGDGGAGGDGGVVAVGGTSSIATTGDGSIGIYGQSVGGAGADGAAGGFIDGMGGMGGMGGGGGAVWIGHLLDSTVDDGWNITTSGSSAHAILAESRGAAGGDGNSQNAAGDGGAGNNIEVSSSGSLVTSGVNAHGIYALSVGSTGGMGGSGAGISGPGTKGGDGGDGGLVDVRGSSSITTSLDGSIGILALSQGGQGGIGGEGRFSDVGGDGGFGGVGGNVTVDGAWTIVTSGDQSHGISATSQGGAGGRAGSGGWIAGGSGTGGASGRGGAVEVAFGPADGDGAKINTSGESAHGIFAQSVGGFAGPGASGSSIFSSSGGNGGSAGSGGQVEVTNLGLVTTTGTASDAILAQSVGGGGGSGGRGSGLFNGGGGTSQAGGDGGLVNISNGGVVQTAGQASRAIFAQSVGGSGGNAAAQTGAWASIGSTGGQGGDGMMVTVQNTGQLVTSEDDAAGVFAQSVGGGGGHGSNALGAGLFGSATIGGVGGGGGDGGSVYVANAGGSIQTGEGGASGDRSPGVFAQSVGGGGGNGGYSASVSGGPILGALALALGGPGGDGGRADAVEVDSSGSITTHGADATGLFAQSVGGSGGNGGFSFAASVALNGAAASLSIGGAGGDGDDGGAVTVGREAPVSGEISTAGDRSYGILAQSTGGGGGNGGASIAANVSNGASLALSFGGGGGDGGKGDTVVVDSVANIATSGGDALGIVGQSVGGGGGSGGFSVAGSIGGVGGASLAVGGGGGSGGTAGDVNVTSAGTVDTVGERSHGVMAQSAGGSGGSGGFSVAGGISGGTSLNLSMGGAGGSGGTSGTATLVSEGSVSTSGREAHGLLAQSLGGGGGTGGFSVAGGISNATSISLTRGGRGGTGNDAGDVELQSTGLAVATSGDGADAIAAKSTGGGGGSGGFSVAGGIAQAGAINFSMGGTGGAGGNGGLIGLISTSSVTTTGGHAHGIFAESLGGGGGAGGFSVAGGLSRAGAISVSLGGDGAGGGEGKNVVVASQGTAISTGELLPMGQRSGDRASGIVARSTGGGGGDAGFSVAGGISQGASLSFSLGGSGGAAGNAGQVDVTSSSNVTTHGVDAPGIQAASQGGGGGSGGFSVAGGASIDGVLNVSLGGAGGAGGHAGRVNVGLVSDPVTGEIVTQSPISGSIQTLGDRSVGIQATSRGGGGGNGGFSVAGGLSMKGPAVNLSVGGFGESAGDAQEVHLLSEASIATSGEQAHGIQAQSLGGGGGNGGFSVAGGLSPETGVNLSVGGFGAKAGLGSLVDVNNSGAITTAGGTAHAIQAQSQGGGGGNGGFSVAGNLNFKPGTASKAINVSVGGFGGDGNRGGAVGVDNAGQLATAGAKSHGISAQSTGGGGGDGGFSAVGGLSFTGTTAASTSVNLNASVGGFGGAGNVGGEVAVVNRGHIRTTGTGSKAISAVSAGGGGGQGGFSNAFVVGLGATSEGKTIDIASAVGGFGGDGNRGGPITIGNEGTLITDGAGSHGVFAQSIGGGGGDAGDAAALPLALDKSCSEDPTCTANQNNNWKVAISVGGFGGSGSDGSAVDVVNTGRIETQQEGSNGVVAQSIGGGGGNGGNGIRGGGRLTGDVPVGLIVRPWKQDSPKLKDWKVTVGGDAGASGNGAMVRVVNDAAIKTQGIVLELEEGEAVGVGREGGYAILAQSIGGGGGTSLHSPRGGTAEVGATGLLGLGGAGGAAGHGGAVDVFHGYVIPEGDELPIPSPAAAETVETFGDGAHAILAQSVGGGGGIAGDANGAVPVVPEAISYGLNELFGRGGGSSGDGGTVAVRSRGNIVTHGDEAIGILAQSIGGGGGIGGNILVVDVPVVGALFELGKHYGSVGGDGFGGTVTVDQVGDITTQGAFAHGIFAQSAGGVADSVALTTIQTDADGNPVLDENGQPIQIPVLDNQGQPVLVPDTGDLGSPIQVNVVGNILTSGIGSHGIFAQSLGDDGNGSIIINIDHGTIRGGLDGNAVHIMDGLDNNLTNAGTLTTIGGIHGMAVRGGNGNETIANAGNIEGSIDLGAGANQINNLLEGILKTGSFVDLGGGQLSNDGAIEPGGHEATMLTTLTGDLDMSSTSSLEIELAGNILGDEYDSLDVTGSALLEGTLKVSLLELKGDVFSPEVGDVFDILSAETISNEFSLLDLPQLDAGQSWMLDYLIDEIASTDIVRLRVVPEPATAMLMIVAGLIGFAWRGRRLH